MKITYLTLFPDLIRHYLEDAFLKKASSKGLIDFEIINIRDFSDNPYQSVDEKPYGGGDGMILRPEIAKSCYGSINRGKKNLSIYMSPQGTTLTHDLLNDLLRYEQLIILNGRYGGVDQRVINENIDLEISVGDFVLSGGELGSLILTEALSRLIPGVLGDFQSVEQDSFYNGLLECPQFTKPQDNSVPEVLLSGHHQKIQNWKKSISLFVTWKKRKDLFDLNYSQYLDLADFRKIHQNIIQGILDSDLRVLGFSDSDRQKYLNYLNELYKVEIL